MRILLVHYWLTGFAGGERVLSAIAGLFPSADILTHVVNPLCLDATLSTANISTTFIAKMPFAKRLRKAYLPLMPLALESVDISKYDLVISSESGPAKGVIRSPNAVHICYCHSPMRYIWDLRHEYLKNKSIFMRLPAQFISHRMRIWDVISSFRVDHFIANSRHTARRIQACYRRFSCVIHPPVDVKSFSASEKRGEYYLVVGRLVQYKRFDLAVEACAKLDRPLVVVGDGPAYRSLASLAGDKTVFTRAVPDDRLRELYSGCKALLFPGEEDFGITAVEAMASGRPVIAYAAGGALETVIEGVTGAFFQEPTVPSLMHAIEDFEQRNDSYNPNLCRTCAEKFSLENFQQQFKEFVDTIIH